MADPVLASVLPTWFRAWKPKVRQTLSEWSRRHARLGDGSKYKAWPCQDGIADAFTQAGVTQLTVRKSSRIGYSQIVQNYIGYCIDQSPTRLLIYQPTIDDAENYAKDDLAPVLDWPVVRRTVVFKPRSRDNQIRAKRFPGGWIQIKGANSPKEFRRVTADKVLLEEPDGYPRAAGKEGDQVSLAYKRCLTSDDPLKAAGSTPTIKNASKIDALFQAGTQEYRHVPCYHCKQKQKLVWGNGTGPGIRWAPKVRPTRAWYQCVNGCEIDQVHLPWMDQHGEWVAEAPENFPHRSFHIWSAYSQFAGAAWLELAREFLEVRHDPNRLMVFVNQVLGETWEVKGEAPEWRRLYERREEWEPGIIPAGGLVLTAGLDVQNDRIEVFVWAWGADRQCWLVDHQVLEGNPFRREVWALASDCVQRSWRHENGAELRLHKVGADTGFATMQVEAWCRRHPGLVIPVKGASTLSAPVFAWSDVREAAARGGKRKRGMRHGMVGGHTLTLELYGLLNLNPPTEGEAAAGGGHPAGYVHLPRFAGEEVCKQMVGDQWVEDRGEWRKVHATEALDGWKYARAMLSATGIERWSPSAWRALAASLLQAAGKAAVSQSNTAPDAPKTSARTPEKAPAKPGAAVPAPQRPPPPARKVGRGGYMNRIGR